MNASGVVKESLSELNGSGSPLQGALNTFRNEKNPDVTGKPNACINWILVDEQFNYVSTLSGAQFGELNFFNRPVHIKIGSFIPLQAGLAPQCTGQEALSAARSAGDQHIFALVCK